MSEDHIDLDVLRSTLRVHVSGPRRNSVTRFEIVKALLDGGVPGKDMASVFRCEAPNTWFATLSNIDLVDRTVTAGPISCEQFVLHPEPCDQRRLTIRVQWLPSWIADNAIASYFEGYGKVINVHREETDISGVTLETGTRVITMVIREGDQDDIPHRIRIFGKTALIMVPGRPPICLRCQQVGHVQSKCPERPVETTKLSYAAKATAEPIVLPTQDEKGPTPPNQEETASPSPGGSGVSDSGKRNSPEIDEEGFQRTKRGRHTNRSPEVLSNGDLVPGQRFRSVYMDMSEGDDSDKDSDDRLVIDEDEAESIQ
ncbi:uncharacterized protein LOC132558435 [Ylistrum balloti]|uniref:uncharacterized protein LOC132558435 n=1 Tax=Ylistrum balloti TaxID=509963 RepID=UPI0029057F46|nr:uncharacterized protein LOC132558435 [Ylistrum balloti]